MEQILPLNEMTTAQKLRMLEELWEDLCRTPEDIPSPEWHSDVLRAREQRMKAGAAQLVDWSEAKNRIKDAIK